MRKDDHLAGPSVAKSSPGRDLTKMAQKRSAFLR